VKTPSLQQIVTTAIKLVSNYLKIWLSLCIKLMIMPFVTLCTLAFLESSVAILGIWCTWILCSTNNWCCILLLVFPVGVTFFFLCLLKVFFAIILLHFNFGVYCKYFDAFCFMLSNFLQLHPSLNSYLHLRKHFVCTSSLLCLWWRLFMDSSTLMLPTSRNFSSIPICYNLAIKALIEFQIN
jgi:hypothetical protein